MTFLEILASGTVISVAAVHAATVGASIWAVHRPLPQTEISEQPGVTVLRPVCGLENNLADTLRSTFTFGYEGAVQLVFCCDDADDPAVPMVNDLIAQFPNVDAQLLIGRDTVSGNPKLNNLVKGWNAARHDFVLMADSNVLLPHDYIQRLFARWTPDTGLVTSPPVGIRPTNAAGHLEAAFLNTYQDRWQLTSDVFRNGFAQGKILFWRRDVLEAAGGLEKLGRDMAEDVASTKAVRGQGLHVRLLGDLLPQPIGDRTFKDVWKRQVRWAMVRRMGFPALYAAEILSSSAVPLILSIILAAVCAIPWVCVLALAVFWFGLEWLLAWAARWPHGVRDVGAMIWRDALLPAVWIAGWRGKEFEWRGNAMSSDDTTG